MRALSSGTDSTCPSVKDMFIARPWRKYSAPLAWLYQMPLGPVRLVVELSAPGQREPSTRLTWIEEYLMELTRCQPVPVTQPT